MARIIAWIAVVVHLFAGLFAFVAPRAFYDNTAVFPPYNQHFIQDIGSFMIGLGAVLLIALTVKTDALGVALLGVGIGSAAHTLSHVIGSDLGGEPARDIPMLVVMTVALLAAGSTRLRKR